MHDLTLVPRLKPDLKAILQTSVNHLVKQRRQSIAPNGNGCRYRGVGGTACSVGCLIPDALYDGDVEGSIVHVFNDGLNDPIRARNRAAVAQYLLTHAPSIAPDALASFLAALQAFHDNEDYLTLVKQHPGDEDLHAAILRHLDRKNLSRFSREEWFA
jgi:hypothetical protein